MGILTVIWNFSLLLLATLVASAAADTGMGAWLSGLMDHAFMEWGSISGYILYSSFGAEPLNDCVGDNNGQLAGMYK